MFVQINNRVPLETEIYDNLRDKVNENIIKQLISKDSNNNHIV